VEEPDNDKILQHQRTCRANFSDEVPEIGCDMSVLEIFLEKTTNHFPLADQNANSVVNESDIKGSDEVTDKPNIATVHLLFKFNVVQKHREKMYFFDANYEQLEADYRTSKNKSNKWIKDKNTLLAVENARTYYHDHGVFFNDFQPAVPFLPPKDKKDEVKSTIPATPAKRKLSGGGKGDQSTSKKPKKSSSSVTPKTSNKAVPSSKAKAPKPSDPLASLGTHLKQSQKSREIEMKKQKENDARLRKEKEEREKKIASSLKKKKGKEEEEEEEEDPEARLKNRKDKSTPKRQQPPRGSSEN
jgi:hypothetical protein